MSVTMISKNGNIDSSMKFDDDFVAKTNRNSQVRNRSFKPPSPLFQQKTNDENNNQIIYTGSNGRISSYVSDVFNKRASTRSRRTSTPPFSSEFNEIECNTAKSRLQSANSQASVNISSPRSASTSSSPKAPVKKRSSSSFMKKLSFKFKSSSTNQSTERTDLNDKSFNMSNFSNKYNSAHASSELYKPRSMQTASTQTIESNNQVNNNNYFKNTSNFNDNVNTAHATGSNTQGELDLDAMQKVFNVFDSDHDGSITIEDVEKVMNSLQHLKNEIEMPSVSQIKVAFDKFDANKNGSIEFDEFLEILRCAGAQNSEETSAADESILSSKLNDQSTNNNNDINTERVKTNMRIIFEQFDKDNDGKITKNELNFVMQNLFPEEVITEKDIEGMLRAADLDKNGFIDFDEFANMFMLHSTNNAVLQNNNEQSYIVNSSAINSYHSKKNTSVSNLINSETLARSNKSLSKTISRSSSKEPSRSRNPSGQRSEQNSPSTFKKVVQIFTASQMMDLKAAFHMFDKNGDEKISEKELYEVMKYLGVSATEKDVRNMIQVVDKNKNGCVDYDEFIQMMTKTQLKPLSHEEELRKTFNIFDIDGNGLICHEEIKQTMTHLGENISDDEVRDMIKAADKNGDGQIDINEFSGLLNGTNVFKS